MFDSLAMVCMSPLLDQEDRGRVDEFRHVDALRMVES